MVHVSAVLAWVPGAVNMSMPVDDDDDHSDGVLVIMAAVAVVMATDTGGDDAAPLTFSSFSPGQSTSTAIFPIFRFPGLAPHIS